MAFHNTFGCWCVLLPSQNPFSIQNRHYLPQIELQAHTSIHSTVSRTKLRQVFINNTFAEVSEVRYSFPLYDGVSVVSFKCTVGEKVIFGLVKEKNQARTDYNEAKARGEVAGLLEQTHDASDVFTTRIGNVPQNAKAVVEIEYIGELTHDAQLDGIRFTIPCNLTPRYGTPSSDLASTLQPAQSDMTKVVVDVEMDDNVTVHELFSPNHAIQQTLGKTSTQNDVFKSNRATATLLVKPGPLEKDFVLVVKAPGNEIPKALLEEHPTIRNQRALMATLAPRFNLPNIHPEIVFVVDRSGSMIQEMPLVVEALTVLLKSLPLTAKFNICSFGSNHSFMFPRSVPYDERSLQQALHEVKGFAANYGGTELLYPLRQVVSNRLEGTPLEVMVLTDGEIWNQQQAFDFINEAAGENVRVFSLGIGSGASTSLVNGLARAGNGFAQFVQDNEKMDKRVVRMLKAALSPHIDDYRLELNYDATDTTSDDGFEIVELPTAKGREMPVRTKEANAEPAKISLFDPNYKEEVPNPPVGRYDHLPRLDPPKELQAPNTISGLFPYNRVSVYMLLSNSARKVKSVMLKGTCNGTPVQLEIAVQDIGVGKTIHQLAAKKAMLETEEGRGWLQSAASPSDGLFKNKHSADWDRIVEREAVRLGVQFQVSGKYCSFVAIEAKPKASQEKAAKSQQESGTKPRHTVTEENLSDWDLSTLCEYDLSLQDIESESDEASVNSSPSAFTTQRFGMMQQRQMQYAVPQSSFGGGGFGSTVAAPGSGSVTSFGPKMAMASMAPPPPPPPAASPFSDASRRKEGGLFGSTSSSNAKPSSGFSLFGNTSQSTRGGLLGRQGGLFGSSQLTTTMSSRSRKSFGSSPIEKKEASSGTPIAFGAQPNYAVSRDRSQATSFLAPSGSLFGSSSSAGFVPQVPALTQSMAAPMAAPTSFTTASSPTTRLHQIIALQRFDGSWTATPSLLDLLGITRPEFNDWNVSNKDDTIKATILAVAWMETKVMQEAEVWEMIVDKAKAWLMDEHRGKNGLKGEADVKQVVQSAVGAFFP